MTDLLKFDFFTIEIHDHYCIVVMNEGVTVSPKHNEFLINIVETYFNKKKFVYLSHRINSYAVDPSIYFETSKIDNLIAFAVISKDFKAKSNAEVEKLFLNKPFEIFDTLEDAISWTNKIINAELI